MFSLWPGLSGLKTVKALMGTSLREYATTGPADNFTGIYSLNVLLVLCLQKHKVVDREQVQIFKKSCSDDI